MPDDLGEGEQMDTVSPTHIRRLDVSFHYFEDHPEGYLACVCYFPVILNETHREVFLQQMYGSQMLTWTQVPQDVQNQLIQLRDAVKSEVIKLPSIELGGRVISAPTVKIAEIEVLSGKTVNVKFRTPTAKALANQTVQVSVLSRDVQQLIADLTQSFDAIAHEHLLSKASGTDAGTLSSQKFSLPLRFFYSYSHRDDRLIRSLEEHLALLRREKLIEPWHFRKLSPGTEWEAQIDEHLEKAHVILLLVSSSFLASDYCYGTEMKRAMEKHERGEARVIPIILRPVDWHAAPFGRLQGLPTDGKAVTEWPNRDRAWTIVSSVIRKVVHELTDSH